MHSYATPTTHYDAVVHDSHFRYAPMYYTYFCCAGWCVVFRILIRPADLPVNRIVADADIVVRGHVTWAGATSMEITMHVDQV